MFHVHQTLVVWSKRRKKKGIRLPAMGTFFVAIKTSALGNGNQIDRYINTMAAGCYIIIFPKPLLIMVVLVLGYLGRGSSVEICGTTPATDQINFPIYVGEVLQDLLMNTQLESPDPNSGLRTRTSTSPENSDAAGSGAATGTATCASSGSTGGSCYTCLYALVRYVGPCKKFTTGSAYYPQECSIQFQQL
ncbi:unnamed protein product [Linum trigynum]|uniref:Gnk2-homologous domain-containing protein n=1 Tax=Linum trigynum TaxID=586398 RepID=A0AAV2DFY2_9ROSI